MRRFLATLVVMAIGLQPVAANAVEPDEVLSDPALEAKARALSAEIRCLVCQNQSIDDSDAELAREMRLLVRERLAAGDDEPEIKAYLVSRYGDFVLFRPPVMPSTYLLWFGPFLLMLLGAAAVVFYLRAQGRKKVRLTQTSLSEAEAAELQSLLAEMPPPGSPDKDAGKRSS